MLAPNPYQPPDPYPDERPKKRRVVYALTKWHLFLLFVAVWFGSHADSVHEPWWLSWIVSGMCGVGGAMVLIAAGRIEEV